MADGNFDAELMERKVGRQAARIARLEEELDDALDRISALEAFRLRAGQRYDPVAAAAWIRLHTRPSDNPSLRGKLSRLPGRKRWPTRPELEALIEDLNGDPADLPEPGDLLRVVEPDQETAA